MFRGFIRGDKSRFSSNDFVYHIVILIHINVLLIFMRIKPVGVTGVNKINSNERKELGFGIVCKREEGRGRKDMKLFGGCKVRALSSRKSIPQPVIKVFCQPLQMYPVGVHEYLLKRK